MSTASTEPQPQPASAGRLPPFRRGVPNFRSGALVAMLVAVFLSGGVVGGGVGMMLAQQKFNDCVRHPERLPRRMTSMLQSELRLSAEQTAQVEQIFQRHHEQIEAIRAEVHPRMSAEFTAIGDEVNAVLTPTQQTKWAEMRERFRRDNPSPKRRRGDDDHDKQPSK